jgi:peptidoglycan hydrolase-like protein with peptidoglycan-binding domain
VPDGRHAREAKRRIEALKTAEAERALSAQAQQMLASLGYDASAPDKLDAAVRAFQADNSLSADGKITAELIAEIGKVRAAKEPEIAAHAQARAKRSRAAYESFLSVYATGRLAGDIRARLASCRTETAPTTRQKTAEVSATGKASGRDGPTACRTAESNARAEIQSACPGGVLGRVALSSVPDASNVAAGIVGSIIGGATNRNVNLPASCTATASASCTRVVTETSSREVCD